MLGGVSDASVLFFMRVLMLLLHAGSGHVTFDGLSCNYLLGSEKWPLERWTGSSCVPFRFQYILRVGMAGNDMVVPGGNCAPAYSCAN